MFALGLFDRPVGVSPTADARSDAQTQLAREVATEKTLLLKNAPAILPLDAAALGWIAVVGPAGDASAIFHGSTSGLAPTRSQR